MKSRGIAIAAIALAPACAWDAGGPFGEVSTTLDAQFTAEAGRDAGDGWLRLASDYQVRIEAASWSTSKLVFVATGAAALNFDPAAPPPGYTLCHGGHCHATDGRLVPYEEVAAELAGGKPPAPALELPTGEFDLVAGSRVELACDGGPCDLPRGTVGRIDLEVTGVAIRGRVRDGRMPPRRAEAAFTAAAQLATAAKPAGHLELAVDRANDPEITLGVGVHPGAAIFDGVDWAALGAGPIDAAANPAALAAITQGIGEVELTLDVARD